MKRLNKGAKKLTEPEYKDSKTNAEFDDFSFQIDSEIAKNISNSTKSLENTHHSDSESTTDDENDNRIGNVPTWWYNEFATNDPDDPGHIGYNTLGQKILRPAEEIKTSLDEFLAYNNYNKKGLFVYDQVNHKKVALTKNELNIIKRIKSGKFPRGKEIDFQYISDIGQIDMPIKGNPQQPKSRFLPSKFEQQKILKYVRAIRNGWIKTDEEKAEENKPKPLYLMWNDDGNVQGLNRPKNTLPNISAPKEPPPSHTESYNPPDEYLISDSEKEDRLNDEENQPAFIPQKYYSLRSVPGYEALLQERYNRCLDLYLCPRVIKKKINVDPESLIPDLPPVETLRPFPSNLLLEYKGHTNTVVAISCSPSGQWLASISLDNTMKIWETSTGFCLNTFLIELTIDEESEKPQIMWNPLPDRPFVVISVDNIIQLIPTMTGTASENQEVLNMLNFSDDSQPDDNDQKKVLWKKKFDKNNSLEKIEIETPGQITWLSWHNNGNYLASLSSKASSSSTILFHHITKHKSQSLTEKSKGKIQCISFHPSKPQIIIASQKHIRLFDLISKKIISTLTCPARRISSLDIHPLGDNIIIGSEDHYICWYDLDYGVTPYRTIKGQNIKSAIVSIHYHSRYPLFASGSMNGDIHVFHGRVYSDLSIDPLIVPLKILHTNRLTDLCFHSSQPWVFTSGEDSMIKLFG